MQRVLMTCLGSLLAIAVVAPAAQGATPKTPTRYLEGKVEGGGLVQLGVKYRVKNRHEKSVPKWQVKRGNKVLIPHWLTYSASYSVPLTCDNGEALVDSSFGFFDPPLKLRQFGKSSLAYAEATGRFDIEKMGRKGKRARASGILFRTSVTVFPPSAPPLTNCHTNGEMPWSAHECLRTGSPRKGLPLCRVSGWS